jgi:hypothetical protein
MSVLDLKARSLIRVGGFEDAKLSLEEAKSIWTTSAKEDDVRLCELKCTTGLLLIATNQIKDGIRHLEESVAFQRPSPCVKALHYRHLVSEYSTFGRLEDAAIALALERRQSISW